MAEILSKAEFLEVDITYKASVEMEYLFNAVTFNYTTMKCEHKIKVISILFTYIVVSCRDDCWTDSPQQSQHRSICSVL